MLKGIITEEDWKEWKNDLLIDYVRDNHFTELKDQELLKERLQTMDMVQQYVGEYYSKEWVMKNVLMLSDEEIDEGFILTCISKPGSEEITIDFDDV